MAWTLTRTTASNYFKKPDGTILYFCGHYVWENGQDRDQVYPPVPPPGTYPPTAFGWTTYLNWVSAQGYNFIRYWIAGQVYTTYVGGVLGRVSDTKYPVPYARPGPGTAADNLPKYDLDNWNQAYFDRIRARCIDAAARRIYVDIILFEGAPGDAGGWNYHPFKLSNNINNFNGDPYKTGNGIQTQTMNQPATLRRHKAFVAKVIDTVNDLDNVLYEIANEAPFTSISWQYELINYIHSYESGKAKQHPVGMTAPGWDGTTGSPYSALLRSPADWIAPPAHDGNNFDAETGSGPPAAAGNKIHILDVDHIFPGNFDPAQIDVGQWVWKGFLRGHGVIHMDDVAGLGIAGDNPYPPLRSYDVFRTTLKQTASYAARCNLATTVPNGALCSTGYCIANPGIQYLALRATASGSFTLNLSAGAGKTFSVEWYDVANSITQLSANISGGSSAQSFTSPFSQPSVLFLNVINSEILQRRMGIFFLPGGGSSIVSDALDVDYRTVR
jgi:hypothetical protein